MAYSSPKRQEFKGTFVGGLMPGADILEKNSKVTLADAQNLILSKPVAYLDSVSTQRNCLTTPPPTRKITANTYAEGPTYNAPVFTKTIATFENTDWPSETWTFTGTGTASLVTSFSEGDQCLSLACGASQTATATCTLPAAIDLSSPTYGILVVDIDAAASANFSSGYIRIGSDSTNYRQYDLPNSTPVFNVLKYTFASPSSTTGTPTMSAIQYVQFSLTTNGSGSLTFRLDNLRLASFASVTPGTTTLTDSAGNVYSYFIYDNIIGATAASEMVIACGDSIFSLGASPADGVSYSSQTIKAGFTNTAPSSTNGTNFYFTQFPKAGSASQNILYYVNGKNGYFSYDENASAGSRHARIGSSPYKYICVHKNMIFLAGDVSAPNTIYPSDINDPTTITAGNAVTVQNTSGSYITGLYSMDDYLLITTNTGSFNLYGSDPDSTTGDFVLKKTASKLGCIEQKAGCRYGAQLYHFDGNGICVFDGNDSTMISEGLESKLDSFNRKLCSIYYNRVRDLIVFCFVPSTVADPVVTTSGFYQLTYSPTKRVWGHIGEFSDASSVQFFGVSWGGSVFQKPLVFNGGLQLYQVDPTAPTDISTMTWFAKTNWNDADSPDHDKDFAELSIFVRDIASAATPTVNLYVYTDYDFSTVKQQFVNTAQVTTITFVTVANSTLYRVIINGTNCDYTSDSSATLAEIVAGLTSAINTAVGAAVTAVDTASTSIVITSDAAGTSFDCGVSGSNMIVTETTANNNALTPTDNIITVGLKGVHGVAIAFKIQATCDDQKDEAVMLSGYRGIYTFAEAP